MNMKHNDVLTYNTEDLDLTTLEFIGKVGFRLYLNNSKVELNWWASHNWLKKY